jgi:uncharacterized protein
MKAKLILPLLFMLAFVAAAFGADGDYPERPNPPRLVNDLAGVLSADQNQMLEDKLLAYNDSTSTQLAIVLIHSTGEYSIDEYAIELGDKWGVGQANKDNGIMILAAIDDHRVFIATGEGVEGRMPDMIARRIVDNNIVPYFKNSDYYGGLNEAADVIFQTLTGEFKGEGPQQVQRKGKGSLFFLPVLIILIIVIVLSKLFGGGGRGGRGFRRSGPYMGGGFFGGGGGGFGGGGGGGGFGGFGGGSFGGGGAGGSW